MAVARRVVGAGTGQLLPDVVVLAVWESVSPGVMHEARQFHDVDEVVTDADGRFVLPARVLAPAIRSSGSTGLTSRCSRAATGDGASSARGWPASVIPRPSLPRR